MSLSSSIAITLLSAIAVFMLMALTLTFGPFALIRGGLNAYSGG